MKCSQAVENRHFYFAGGPPLPPCSCSRQLQGTTRAPYKAPIPMPTVDLATTCADAINNSSGTGTRREQPQPQPRTRVPHPYPSAHRHQSCGDLPGRRWQLEHPTEAKGTQVKWWGTARHASCLMHKRGRQGVHVRVCECRLGDIKECLLVSCTPCL